MTAGKHQGPFKDSMPYRPVNYQDIPDHHLKEVFARADLLLKDVYGMFKLPPKLKGAGSGDWALVLVCIIDGIARHVYPTDRWRTPRTGAARFASPPAVAGCLV